MHPGHQYSATQIFTHVPTPTIIREGIARSSSVVSSRAYGTKNLSCASCVNVMIPCNFDQDVHTLSFHQQQISPGASHHAAALGLPIVPVLLNYTAHYSHSSTIIMNHGASTVDQIGAYNNNLSQFRAYARPRSCSGVVAWNYYIAAAILSAAVSGSCRPSNWNRGGTTRARPGTVTVRRCRCGRRVVPCDKDLHCTEALRRARACTCTKRPSAAIQPRGCRVVSRPQFSV